MTSPKVFEIVPYWPAEVFIQRHLLSFSETDISPIIITKKNDYSLRSSSLQWTNQKAIELPRFENQNYFLKFLRTIPLWGDPKLLFDKRIWQKKILLKFFKDEKPDLIHFHWANLAIKLSWIPLELKIPYSFSMRGHDVQELALD